MFVYLFFISVLLWPLKNNKTKPELACKMLLKTAIICTNFLSSLNFFITFRSLNSIPDIL